MVRVQEDLGYPTTEETRGFDSRRRHCSDHLVCTIQLDQSVLTYSWTKN